MSHIKRLLTVFIAVVLVFQAGSLTVFAGASEKDDRVITISNISSSLSECDSDESSTEIRTLGLPSGAVEIIGEEWSCPDEIVISGSNIKVHGGRYSYKLTLRANGTLTFDNDLEIFYQGINGRYQLNYEIDETDAHIMIVTGTFENIIIASPLLEKFSDKSKNYILSHISDDTYFYQLVLKTTEGFTFTNTLRFLFDSKPLGYSLQYTYDLLTDKQKLIISGITDFSDTGSDLNSESKTKTVVAESKTIKLTKQADNKFEIKDANRTVKPGQTTAGAVVINNGTGIKTYKIKAVDKKKYTGYFKIDTRTGKISINKKTPKGTYTVTVQAKAGKTVNCKASGWNTAKVKIIVK